MRTRYNMHGHTVIERKTGPEYLKVIRFTYNGMSGDIT